MVGSKHKDLRWQCRRGMLELDLLLMNFVDTSLPGLDEHQRQVFEKLLAYPDQTLLNLLLGNTVSRDPDIAGLVDHIRSTPFEDA